MSCSSLGLGLGLGLGIELRLRLGLGLGQQLGLRLGLGFVRLGLGFVALHTLATLGLGLPSLARVARPLGNVRARVRCPAHQVRLEGTRVTGDPPCGPARGRRAQREVTPFTLGVVVEGRCTGKGTGTGTSGYGYGYG